MGVETADPVLMLAAARLRKSIAPEPVERAADGGEPGTEAPLGWEAMAQAAEELAEGDDALLGLIDDLRAEGTKGVASGPVYNIGSLSAGKSDNYRNIDFKGGEYAEVYVEAQSSVDLNLTVTDAQGRLVCADSDEQLSQPQGAILAERSRQRCGAGADLSDHRGAGAL